MINGWRKRLENNGGGVMSRNRRVEAGTEDALRSTSWAGGWGEGWGWGSHLYLSESPNSQASLGARARAPEPRL